MLQRSCLYLGVFHASHPLASPSGVFLVLVVSHVCQSSASSFDDFCLVLPQLGSSDELPYGSLGVMLAVIGTPVRSLSEEYGRGSIVGKGEVGIRSWFSFSAVCMCCVVCLSPSSDVCVFSAPCSLYCSLSLIC